MGMVIAMAFLSNIRAMLLSPVYEKTIDSTEDLVLSDTIPIIGKNKSFYANYLRDSSNAWENKAFEIGQTFQDLSMRDALVQTEVYSEGTHALLDKFEFLAYLLLSNPWYKDKTPPYFHISKELVRPY